jgi:hypothetical protein
MDCIRLEKFEFRDVDEKTAMHCYNVTLLCANFVLYSTEGETWVTSIEHLRRIWNIQRLHFFKIFNNSN